MRGVFSVSPKSGTVNTITPRIAGADAARVIRAGGFGVPLQGPAAVPLG
jgi:hypothetical protein